MSDQFAEQYKRLNKAQKEAVDTIEGPVMVIAGPGTGKTTILTLRIANILKQTDTPANGILAITYTDAGVKAMRGKLQGVIGDRAHDVGIFTFHGFAQMVISQHPDHFVRMSDMKLMTDIEQESLIRSIIADPHFSDIRPAGKPDAYVMGIMRSVDDAKREALTPDMVREHAVKEIDRIKNDESSISTRGATKGQLKADAKDMIEKCERTKLFAEVYEAYETKKREANKMDFNDLIFELLFALRNDELLLRLIQEQYLYIHVDEHQDTNDAQNFIVGLIAEFFETPNIFIVGDEKQAIYRFQGASVENFLKLQKQWPMMKLISLDTNYRSHKGILEASFAMIEHNYEEDEYKDLRIRLKGGRTEDARALEKAVSVVTGENVSASELHLVHELQTLSKNEPHASVAIIVRRNRDLDRVIRLLETHSISVSSERSIDIFSHPVGRIFFDLIEYIADSSRTDALAKTVISGAWKLSFGQRLELIKALKSGHDTVERLIPQLVHIRRKILNDSAIGFLIYAAEESSFISLISRDPAYVYVWRGIISLAESLARESDIRDPLELIKGMLAYRTSAESRIVKVTVGAPDVPIRAMTAHGSKGLEFDYVFIPYATEESWVGRPRGSSFVLPKKQTTDSDIRDVRRLFYVALTRARKQVTVITALEESDGKVLSPLRFIDELDTNHVVHTVVPRVGLEEVFVNDQRQASTGDVSGENLALQHVIKQVLSEKGLSVTALSHFMECPNRFIYNSILKLPQAPSVSAEKGTAMHEAISRVWKSESRTTKDIEEILNATIVEFFAKSFLPVSEKKSAQKELLETISDVAKELESHFAIQGTVFTESWIEHEFLGTHGDQSVRIPIHGKLDVLIDTGTEARVFDYKTKQAMSVNAIKGLTKSDDGSYFRQLIFYKMLVGGDIRWKMKRVSPALVFVSPDDKGRCPTVSIDIADDDIVRVRSEIQSLVESVWSGTILTRTCTDEKCEWCGMRNI